MRNAAINTTIVLMILVLIAPFVSAGQRRNRGYDRNRRDDYRDRREERGLNPEGQPREFRQGEPQHYFVWHDDRGWHVRTTTASERHRFHGTITSTSPLREVRAVNLEGRRDWLNVSRDSRTITFNLTTAAGQDGFDFLSSGSELQFNLLIDGKERPNLISIGSNGSQPDTIPFAISTTTSAQTASQLNALGQPTGMGEGSTHRFLVWRDNDGTWHLRTTTAGQRHKFSGQIESQGGSISSLRAVSRERGDWVNQRSQNRINFDLTTEGAIDGFDFRTNGTALVFRLEMDGQERAQNVYIGSRGTNPDSVPFTLPTR